MAAVTSEEKTTGSAENAASAPRAPRDGMWPGERALLEKVCAGVAPDGLFRTGTRVDVAAWFRRGRVWAACLRDELVLLADGPTAWVLRLPRARLRDSLYNYQTGELLLAPGDAAEPRRLKLPPAEALRLRRWINGENHA